MPMEFPIAHHGLAILAEALSTSLLLLAERSAPCTSRLRCSPWSDANAPPEREGGLVLERGTHYPPGRVAASLRSQGGHNSPSPCRAAAVGEYATRTSASTPAHLQPCMTGDLPATQSMSPKWWAPPSAPQVRLQRPLPQRSLSLRWQGPHPGCAASIRGAGECARHCSQRRSEKT